MKRHTTDGVSGGRRKQSAVAQRSGFGGHRLRAHGLNLRGVITQTYVQLDGTSPLPEGTFQNITAVYCDVLVYSSIEGYRNGPLARVPVMQHLGMHGGHVWTPKPSRVDVSTGVLDPATADPMNLDGDHVRIEFLEDDLSRPIITGRIPHPRVGQGNENLVAIGHRMKLKEADGLVDFWKHNGTYFGVDKDGNFVVDTTRAHSGETAADGGEVPKDDATHGDVVVKVNNKNSFVIEGLSPDGALVKFWLELKDNEIHLKLVDGETLKLVGKDGSTVMTVGDGAKHVAIVEALQALYTSLKTTFDGHYHLDTALRVALAALATDMGALGTAVGIGATSAAALSTYFLTTPPAAPEVPPTPAPAWDPAINSTKVKIPNG